jgi:FkbM family methyltransferase
VSATTGPADIRSITGCSPAGSGGKSPRFLPIPHDISDLPNRRRPPAPGFRVIAIEAQERLFYCLAGNIAINNCFNARAIHAAVGAADGMMSVPTLDYLKPARFGSVELKQRENPEFIGQAYGPARASVPAMRLDVLELERIDLIKIDVEGMELDVLEGARTSIDRYHPILTIETIKTDFDRLTKLLAELDYQVFQLDRINIAAIHRSDKTASHVKSA